MGRTTPKASIRIDFAQVVTANPANDPLNKDAKTVSTVSDGDGDFKIAVELPLGYVQIPLEVTVADSSQPSIYIVSLEVLENKLNMAAKLEEDSVTVQSWREKLQQYIENQFGLGLSMNEKLKGLWLTGAVGFNYQTYSQSTSGTTKLDFNSLSYPSLGLRATYAQPQWMVKLAYLHTPGKVTGATEPFTVEKSRYHWTTMQIEFGKNSAQETYREKIRLTYLAGIQQHLEPSFNPEFSYQITQQSVQLTNASLGAEIWAKVANQFLLEGILRYQYPLEARALSRNGFEVSPDFFFDGSVGLYYEYATKRYLGLVWFGQWHRYRFSYRSELDGREWIGSQNLFYTNLDFRYVFQF